MAAASSSFSITQEELNLFHYIDRQLYTILVMHLWRNPAESWQVMALWLWLERVSFENVVHKILCLPYTLVNELADEAVLCLNIIKNTTSTNNNAASSSEANEVPMTQYLMKKDISIQFFHENRLIATHGIGQVMNEICNRALSDIMQEAVRRNAAQSMAESQNMMANPLKQPGRPPQTVVGQPEQQQIWGTPEAGVVCPEDRTMFVTLSKGYPVTEREVREFFTRSHGDCIESFHMQEVQQVPFARVVFKSTATIDGILNGMSKIKFAINGKPVWFRRFVPKNLAVPATELPIKFSFEFPHGF